MPALQDVHLPRSTTDEGMRALAGCKSLRVVTIHDAAITDGGLAALAALPALESVSLPAGVTDAGLLHVQRIAALKSVGFHGSNITAKGYALLRDCRRLETVSLVQVKLTDENVAALATLTRIKRLMLQQCQPTAEQVQTLKRALPNCDVGSW
jgi:hypothetical protein